MMNKKKQNEIKDANALNFILQPKPSFKHYKDYIEPKLNFA